MAGNPELFEYFAAWYGDKPAALALIRALSYSACRCGSGGHPRRCEVHPNAYDHHVRELNEELAVEDALTAADALADAVEETTAAISEYYPSDEPDIVGTFELREALRAYRAARGTK